MKSLHEEVINIVEKEEVTTESDQLIQHLATEMEQEAAEYEAILEAANRIVKKPDTDPSVLGRIKRMSNIFSEDELNDKIGLLVDVIFTNDRLPA